MARWCPHKDGPALYTECLECDEKACRTQPETEKPETKKPVRIIIAGTRRFNDYRLLRRILSEAAGTYPKEQLEIISGGAKGADGLGELFAERNNLKLTRFPADWNRHGKAAGPIRNRQMAEYAGKDGLLVAFWDEESRGTRNMIETAEECGLFLRVVSIKKERYGKTLTQFGTEVYTAPW